MSPRETRSLLSSVMSLVATATAIVLAMLPAVLAPTL